jgi:hypothetical protein
MTKVWRGMGGIDSEQLALVHGPSSPPRERSQESYHYARHRG